jgi:hypothetical protein
MEKMNSLHLPNMVGKSHALRHGLGILPSVVPIYVSLKIKHKLKIYPQTP